MKYLFILFFLTSIYYSKAQKSFFHPKLSKNPTAEASRITPFAIANNENNKAIKKLNTNWKLHREKKFADVHGLLFVKK